MSVTLVLVCATDLVDIYSGTTATAVDKSDLMAFIVQATRRQ